MRLVKVSAPAGKGDGVSQIAFSVEINKVSRRTSETRHADGRVEKRDVVDVETSTPQAKRFIDALLAADFYNQQDFSINVRQPMALINEESIREVTAPIPATATEICEELFQFAHITYGFVGRIFIAAGLLAYGMVNQKILIMIAGLLFLPLLPLLQAACFGALTRHWKLTGQGLLAFLTATVLLVLGGVIVGSLSSPPIKYDEFNSIGVSALISLAVGVAAGLAIIDDAGKREMIGLAASAQIAIVPVWFGLCLALGFPATASRNDIITRGASFFINLLTIIIAAAAVHFFSGSASRSMARIND